MLKVQVNVTKEVLERTRFCGIDKRTGIKLEASKSNTGRNCGIGDAVSDLLPTAWVGLFSIQLYDAVPDWEYTGEHYSFHDIPLPDEAREFISEFDNSTPEQRAAMQPISFTIEVPDSVIDKIGIEQVTEILSKSETLTRVI
jgi:hypothetical protein